jgi:1-acyl-sn-glycerol-3-phosphate acyltransferase
VTSDLKPAKATVRKFKYPSPIVTGILRAIGFTVSKLFWALRYHAVENIPNDHAGMVVVSNHASYIDPVWIAIPIHQDMRFMAWDEAFDWPVVGPLIRYLGAFPVKTQTGVAKTAIAESLRSIRAGGVLLIFPEGEREFSDGKMLEFKPGAAHIAMNAGVPILPVSIRGGSRIWPQGRKYPRLFRRVEITFHPPMHMSKPAADVELEVHLDKINDQLVEVIRSAM